jgi:hypothetical protein
LRTVRRLRERPEQCLHDDGALIAQKKARPPIVTVPLRTISLFSAGLRKASSVWKSAARNYSSNFL